MGWGVAERACTAGPLLWPAGMVFLDTTDPPIRSLGEMSHNWVVRQCFEGTKQGAEVNGLEEEVQRITEGLERRGGRAEEKGTRGLASDAGYRSSAREEVRMREGHDDATGGGGGVQI